MGTSRRGFPRAGEGRGFAPERVCFRSYPLAKDTGRGAENLNSDSGSRGGIRWKEYLVG